MSSSLSAAHVTALVSFANLHPQFKSGRRLYDGDTLEESPPVPLRPIRDGHFTTGQGFVTFVNASADGRMQHLASRRRLHKRSG